MGVVCLGEEYFTLNRKKKLGKGEEEDMHGGLGG